MTRRPALAAAALTFALATLLSCSSREAPPADRAAAAADTAPAPAAAGQSAAGVLALGTSFLALTEWQGALAVVEPCDAAVESLAVDTAAARPRLYHLYGQHAVVFDVSALEARDSTLRLEISSEERSGVLRIEVRDRSRGVVEITEETDLGRRGGPFVVAARASAFPRVPAQPPRCETP